MFVNRNVNHGNKLHHHGNENLVLKMNISQIHDSKAFQNYLLSQSKCGWGRPFLVSCCGFRCLVLRVLDCWDTVAGWRGPWWGGGVGVSSDA